MNRYTVLLSVFVLGVFLRTATAQEDPTLKKLKNTAASLDDLIQQEEPKKGKSRWNDHTLKPIKLSTVTPLIAERLKISEVEIKQLLESKSEKLSRIALARAISEKSGESWRDLLLAHKNDTLYEELQKQNLSFEEAHTLLENLYVDISFASFDPITGSTSKPSGSSKAKKISEKQG